MSYYLHFSTDKELLETFPEAKEIIPRKIKKWKKVKQQYLKQIEPLLRKISKIEDDFSRWFWEEALKVVLDERFREAITNLARLKRLKLLGENEAYGENVANLEKAKEEAKGEQIVSLYPFERLRRIGNRYQALCPLHKEKTPSFVIYADNTFYCFGCHQGGDAIKFIMLLKEYPFKDAIGFLARR